MVEKVKILVFSFIQSAMVARFCFGVEPKIPFSTSRIFLLQHANEHLDNTHHACLTTPLKSL